MSDEKKTAAEEIKEKINSLSFDTMRLVQRGEELSELINKAAQKNTISKIEADELEIDLLKTVRYTLQQYGKMMDALDGGGFEYSTAINKLTTKR